VELGLGVAAVLRSDKMPGFEERVAHLLGLHVLLRHPIVVLGLRLELLVLGELALNGIFLELRLQLVVEELLLRSSSLDAHPKQGEADALLV